MSEVLPDPIAQLENAHVLDASGARFRLGELWRDRPAVLVFIRHFG